MKDVKGVIVLLCPDRLVDPAVWHVVGGRVITRASGRDALKAVLAADAVAGPVMLVLPSTVAPLRGVDLDPAMPLAQARVVAARKAVEGAIAAPAELHAVVIDRMEDDAAGRHEAAMIARADLSRIIDWAREQGAEADIILPLAAIMPEPAEGYVRAEAGGIRILRGHGVSAQADEPWVEALTLDTIIVDWPTDQIEQALINVLAKPPVNLRTGPFAVRQRSGADAKWMRRVVILLGLLLLLSLSITVALIARYAWSISKLDAQTIAIARPYAPGVADAESAAQEIDRLVMEKGGAYAFTGPLAGLMDAMRPVPGVSLSALSLNEDRLLHATLASARAEDINAVLIAVQGAGFHITATSSSDPGGRVIAEITVKP